MEHQTLFDYLKRQRDRRRLQRALIITDGAYWLCAGALSLAAESTHPDLALMLLVAFVMLSVWLALLVGEAVRLTQGRAVTAWMLATLLLGPLGALVIPLVQMGRLRHEFL